MMCELCGKKSEISFISLIEGVKLEVCKDCSSYGKILKEPELSINNLKNGKSKDKSENEEEVLNPKYYEIIKRARISRNMDQEEFAKLLNEKLSIVQKVERGDFEPAIHIARKWEKILKIKIVDKIQDSSSIELADKKSKGESFTLGDFIKKK